MARKAKTKSADTSSRSAPQIVIDPTDDTAVYYANYAEVSAGTGHDFALSFARLPAKLSAARIEELTSTGKIIVEPLFQVFLPPTVIPSLIRALQTTKAQVEEMTGEPIRDPGAAT